MGEWGRRLLGFVRKVLLASGGITDQVVDFGWRTPSTQSRAIVVGRHGLLTSARGETGQSLLSRRGVEQLIAERRGSSAVRPGTATSVLWSMGGRHYHAWCVDRPTLSVHAVGARTALDGLAEVAETYRRLYGGDALTGQDCRTMRQWELLESLLRACGLEHVRPGHPGDMDEGIWLMEVLGDNGIDEDVFEAHLLGLADTPETAAKLAERYELGGTPAALEWIALHRRERGSDESTGD